jgi:hypothetical protein
MRRLTIGLGLTGLLLFGVPLSVAATASPPESRLAQLANQERVSRGLNRLTLGGPLSDVARRHSQNMAAQGRIFHNPSLSSQVSNWAILGENVGRGGSAAKIHELFMASGSHRHQILRPGYQRIGVGVVARNGTLWVTEVFADWATQPAAAPARARPAPARPRPAPRPPAAVTGPQAAVEVTPPSPPPRERKPLSIPRLIASAELHLPAGWLDFDNDLETPLSLPALALLAWVGVFQLYIRKAGWVRR